MISERSAKAFCCEDISLIENYEQAINDNTQTWHVHHRIEISENKSMKQLIAEGRYYRVKAEELIFLTYRDHCRLHTIGKPLAKDRKNKISENIKRAWQDPEYIKKQRDARKRAEWKQKQRDARKRIWQDPILKQKILDARKRACQNPEYLDKLRKSRIGRRWYTDGINNRYVAECPGEGWNLGKTNHKKRS